MDPILVVLASTLLAALAAPLGILPLAWRDTLPLRWIGWSNALAAGFMSGAAYVIAETGLSYDPVLVAGGAVLGIAFIYWTHSVSGTDEFDLNKLTDTEPAYGYKVLLVSGLHSASEGIAIGVAMLESLPFGIFVAIAMAIHNLPEATILGAILRANRVKLSHAAALAMATNAGQILLAITTYAVAGALPQIFPAALGFSVGALIFLVMSELLPQSYRQAGHTSIALVSSLAMGIVVLLKDLSK